jgi:toxin ParE1/3/4
MARKYRLSARAELGLDRIWRGIAGDNVDAADALFFKIMRKIEAAAEHPGLGSPRPDIGEGVRMLVEGNYNIYYAPSAQIIVVTAIVHSKRLPANWS